MCAQSHQGPHEHSDTADAKADADGKLKPAKRARLSDGIAAHAQQAGTASSASDAAQPTSDEQPDYLAGVSEFVRAAEKVGPPFATGDGPDDATASARTALKEAEDSVSALLSGEPSTSVSK
jgi:hypothetical protein